MAREYTNLQILNANIPDLYGHIRLAATDDVFEVTKGLPFGIHIFMTRAQTTSLPNPEESGSALIIATVIEPGRSILLLSQKLSCVYKAQFYGGELVLNWTEI